MQHCEYAGGCLYHHGLDSEASATAAFMRIRYCQGGSETCARFIAARRVEPEMVPPELFPNDEASLIRILAEAGG